MIKATQQDLSILLRWHWIDLNSIVPTGCLYNFNQTTKFSPAVSLCNSHISHWELWLGYTRPRLGTEQTSLMIMKRTDFKRMLKIPGKVTLLFSCQASSTLFFWVDSDLSEQSFFHYMFLIVKNCACYNTWELVCLVVLVTITPGWNIAFLSAG